jgi:hypothetical protein
MGTTMHKDSVLLGYDTVSVDNQIPKPLLLQHSDPWIRRNYVALIHWDPVTCLLSTISQKDGILSHTTVKTSTHICTGPILDTFQTQCFGNCIRISGGNRIHTLLRTFIIILRWNYLLLTAKTAYQWLQITTDFYCNMFWSCLAKYHWNISE